MLFFIGPLHFGDRQPAVVGHLKHLSSTTERKRHISLVVLLCTAALNAAQLFFGHHKAATDGKVCPTQEKIVIGIECRESHAVGVPRQRSLPIQYEIDLRIEMIGQMSFGFHLLLGKNLLYFNVHNVGINRIRQMTAEPQNDGSIRRMPDAGICKRAVQARFQPVDFRMRRPWPVSAYNFIEKHARSRHRAHRMRTGRPNANLVKIENRQKHSTPSAAVIKAD